MDSYIVYYILAAVLVLIGLAGIILPALPGLPLVYAGLLLAAWAEGFSRIGVVTLVILGLLTLLSLVVDFFATALGANRVGASRKALWGSVLGTVVGLFFMPLGIFIGPFVGAAAGELWHDFKWRKAAKVGVGTWLGILLGIVLKLTLGFAMLGLFVFAWFF